MKFVCKYQESDLPRLRGTLQEVKWASKIRKKYLEEFCSFQREVSIPYAQMQIEAKGRVLAEMDKESYIKVIEGMKELIFETAEGIFAKEDASFFINNRKKDLKENIPDFCPDYIQRFSKVQAAAERQTEHLVEEINTDDVEQALLRVTAAMNNEELEEFYALLDNNKMDEAYDKIKDRNILPDDSN